MNVVRVWHPSFRYYEELIGIECAREEDVKRLIKALYTEDLRTCPRDIIVTTVVVPKEAVNFLPLENVEHKKVELRDRSSLSDKVEREVYRRFLADEDNQPHFYTTGHGWQRTCCKYLVPLTVVQEIEALNI